MLSFALSLSLVALAAESPPRADAAAPLLIANVTVIPLDSDEVLAARDVLIRDGRIAAIEPAGSRRRRTGALRIVEGKDRFLIPGLVDAHVHIATEGAIRASKEPAIAGLELGYDHAYDRQVLLSFLRAGVTAAANMGGSVQSDEDLLWLRDQIARGQLAGPRLFVGKRINGPRAEVAPQRGDDVPASNVSAPSTAADGIAAVQAAQRRGYDFIKPYQFLNRATYAAIVDEARRLHLPSSGHLPELGCAVCADRAFAFAHPLDNIAHAEELGRYGRSTDLAPADIDALAGLVAERKIAVTPTLITLKTILHMYVRREVPAVAAPWDAWVDPLTRLDWAAPQNRYLSAAFRQQPEADTFSAGYDFSRVLVRQLWKRGVSLTVGTDAALPGLPFGVSVHQEMIELREIGLTPLQVLRAASLNALALFAADQGSGAIRVGERADLVLLDADPLADLQNIGRIAGVVAHGHWLSQAEMDAQLAVLAQRNDGLSVQIQLRRQAAAAAAKP